LRGATTGAALSVPLPDGKTLDPVRLLLEALAEEFGLSPEEVSHEPSIG
jgi:hypothetical protein